MKKKIMTITYTCSEDQVNMGETEIMVYILQKLGELNAYDISMKASSADLAEPVTLRTPEPCISIPEFMRERGATYGQSV